MQYTANAMQYTANAMKYTANAIQYTANTIQYTANAILHRISLISYPDRFHDTQVLELLRGDVGINITRDLTNIDRTIG
jgi:hypothetical protein